MTPAQWTELLADKSWPEAYPLIEKLVRATLANVSADRSWSTEELVNCICPKAACPPAHPQSSNKLGQPEHADTRDKLFRALKALAPRGLADCCHRGPARKMRGIGRIIRPWLWHCSGPANNDSVVLRHTTLVDRYEERFAELFGRCVEQLGREETERIVGKTMMEIAA